MMFEVPSFHWAWESVPSRVSKPVSVPVSAPVSAPVQTNTRIHPSFPIYTNASTGAITCGKQQSHLFWIVVLMEQGGFLMDSVDVVSRKKRFDIANKAVTMQADMKLSKESSAQFADCVRTLMTDDRIPIWNPLFMRLLIETSQMNMVLLSDTKKELFAPWKQHRDCIVVRETKGSKEWSVETMSDQDVKQMYPLNQWVPEKKTARAKMSREEMYVVCSMWDINPPKMTKKCMLELISRKLMI